MACSQTGAEVSVSPAFESAKSKDWPLFVTDAGESERTGPSVHGIGIEPLLPPFQMRLGLMVAVKEGTLPPKPLPGAKPQWLALQDKDGSWHRAGGRIDGSDLLMSCKEVKEPVAVRYAYTQHPCGNLLYSKEGMPVSPFATSGY